MKKIINKTYHVLPKYFGEHETTIKGKRPIYLLRMLNEKQILGVISTRTPKNSNSLKRKYIEYIAPDGNESWLRLDLKDGFVVLDLSKVLSDMENVSQHIILTEGKLSELNYFYRSMTLLGLDDSFGSVGIASNQMNSNHIINLSDVIYIKDDKNE